MASATRDIVVIGGSAGASEAITTLLRQVSRDIPAAFFVVQHIPPDSPNHLVDTLNVNGPLLAKQANDGEEIRPGVVYVAAPDRHLLVKRDYVRVTRGPRENRWRPAVDPLFRSAAVACGSRAIGIVVSGLLDDGTAGLLAIKRCGGIAIVQHPDEAAHPDMPRNALANVAVDYTLGVDEIARTLERLVREPVEVNNPPPLDLERQVRIAETGFNREEVNEQFARLTTLSCPECSGPIWEKNEGNTQHYRCAVGHAYGAESMLSAEGEAIEAAVWAAVRLFEQRANILTTMAESDHQAQRTRMERRHQTLAAEAREHANLLRALLMNEHDRAAEST